MSAVADEHERLVTAFAFAPEPYPGGPVEPASKRIAKAALLYADRAVVSAPQLNEAIHLPCDPEVDMLPVARRVLVATIGIIMGVVVIGVLAAGCGGTPAGSATSNQRVRSTASVVGTVVFDRRHFGVVVRVFDASGARVASEYVPPGDDRFRFDLPPGQYELELTKHLAPTPCHYAKAVSVRASRTTHVTFVAAVLTPGCGTY